MSIIDALVLAAPYFKKIHSQDIMIGITDRRSSIITHQVKLLISDWLRVTLSLLKICRFQMD